MRYFRDPPPPMAPMVAEVAGPLGRSDDEREAERRVLDVIRDLFAILDAHGYRRTSDDAALGRAVVAGWALVDEYEGQDRRHHHHRGSAAGWVNDVHP